MFWRANINNLIVQREELVCLTSGADPEFKTRPKKRRGHGMVGDMV